MSNILITSIVGTNDFAIPTNDTELDTATTELDALLSTVSNLAYSRVLAWVEDSGGPGGAEGVRSLNCLVETFTYSSEECPSESEIDTLTAAIESTLEADADITSIGAQYIVIFTATNSTFTDITTAVLVVGNSSNGDTGYNCDYLDLGDGVQLQAALAAAGAGKDVYIRPGTYDLGAGVATAPLTVPAGVRVRGAGKGHTLIETKATGDQGAFLLGAKSLLEDLAIDVTLPTGACSGSPFVVRLNGDRAYCNRVDINFPGTWTSTQAGYTALRAGFEVGIDASSSPADTQLDDCYVGQDDAAPALLDLGESPGDEFACFAVRTSGSPAFLSAVMSKLQSDGGDWSAHIATKSKVLDSSLYNAFRNGVVVSGSASGGSNVEGNHIYSGFGEAGDESGILIENSNLNGVENNYIECSTPTAGQYAISLEAADYNTVTVNRGPGGLVGAVSLDAPSGDNVVTGNQFSGANYNDLGALNEVVHNK